MSTRFYEGSSNLAVFDPVMLSSFASSPQKLDRPAARVRQVRADATDGDGDLRVAL